MHSKTWMAGVAAMAWVSMATAAEPAKTETMKKESCSEHIKQGAAGPAKAAELHAAMADVYEQHAKWTGTATPAAKAESEEMMKLAKMNREVSAELGKLRMAMTDVPNLAPVEHNMAKAPPALAAAHEKVAKIATELSAMTEKMAKENQQMANKLKGVGGSPTMPTDMPSDTHEMKNETNKGMQNMQDQTRDMKNEMDNAPSQQR